MSKKEQIIKSLQPLFEKAEKEDLWFYSNKIGVIWFSPAELKQNHDRGKFLWGPDNWELRDPEIKFMKMVQDHVNAAHQIAAWQERINFQRSLYSQRTCRECGCTDLDCSQCIEKTGKPCYWVEEDLCSACQETQTQKSA